MTTDNRITGRDESSASVPLDQMACNGGSNCLLDSCGMTLHEGLFDPSSKTTTYHKSSIRRQRQANKSWKLSCISEQWLQHGTVMPQLPVLLVPVGKHQEDNKKAMLMMMRVMVQKLKINSTINTSNHFITPAPPQNTWNKLKVLAATNLSEVFVHTYSQHFYINVSTL